MKQKSFFEGEQSYERSQLSKLQSTEEAQKVVWESFPVKTKDRLGSNQENLKVWRITCKKPDKRKEHNTIKKSLLILC